MRKVKVPVFAGQGILAKMLTVLPRAPSDENDDFPELKVQSSAVRVRSRSDAVVPEQPDPACEIPRQVAERPAHLEVSLC